MVVHRQQWKYYLGPTDELANHATTTDQHSNYINCPASGLILNTLD